jgi:hypothetical protein
MKKKSLLQREAEDKFTDLLDQIPDVQDEGHIEAVDDNIMNVKPAKIVEPVYEPSKLEDEFRKFLSSIPIDALPKPDLKKTEDILKTRKERQLEAKELKNNFKRFKNLIKRESFTDIKGYLREMKDNKNPDKTILINMELRNGMHRHFVIALQGDRFEFEKGNYIIDDSFKYYDVDSKIYCLDYHQDCALPVKRRISLNNIKDSIAKSNIDIINAINPFNLADWMINLAISKIVKGEEFMKFMQFVKMWMIILCCGVGFNILLTIIAIAIKK